MSTTTAAPTTSSEAELQAKAKDHLWMHFARQSVMEDGHGVPIITRGEGHHIWDSQGRKYIDGLSGLFVVNAGHGRKRLAEVAARQAEQLAFFPIWSYAHPNAIELADRLASYAPGDLNRVFFSTGGGEAVETAFKLAKYYWKLQGRPTKHKVISRAVAYHGTPQGALAITGIPAMKEMFEPLTPGGFRVPNTNFYRAPEHGDDLEAFGVWAANRIEEMIQFEGPETVAAVFLEPVQNSGGCFPPPPGYFKRVREICDKYDVLLVSDEVICAFGRIGHMFACDEYGYVPDMITCAKAHDERILPHRRDDRQRPHLRALQARQHVVLPRLHVRRSPGVGRRRDGEPRHLRGGEAQRARARELAAVPRRARDAPRPADRRRRARRRLLLRHRAGEGQGDQGDLRRRRVGAPAPRASCRRRCSTPACTAAPTTAATPSCSWPRR